MIVKLIICYKALYEKPGVTEKNRFKTDNKLIK